MNRREKEQMKNAVKLLKKHREDVGKMHEVCKNYNIPYLAPAYRLVVEVVEQLIIDMEVVMKKG